MAEGLEPEECDHSLDTIEHTDSYDIQLQLQRSREEESELLEVDNAEESETSPRYAQKINSNMCLKIKKSI